MIPDTVFWKMDQWPENGKWKEMEKRWVYMDKVMASLRLQLGVAFNVNESNYQ